MRRSRQESEKLYWKRSPPPTTAVSKRLAFHFNSLNEYAWTGKEFAEKLVHSDREGARVSSIIDSDIFTLLEISASAVNSILPEETLLASSAEFGKCWLAVRSLLIDLGNSRHSVSNDLGRKSFLFIYLGVLFMRECVGRSVSTMPVLRQDLVFAAETYPLTEEEIEIVRSLPISLFEGRSTFSDQLNGLCENINLLILKVR